MRGIKRFGFSLILMSVTACAPVVYDANYRAPTGYVSVQTTQAQPSYRHVTNYQQVRPIEVTLLAENNYLKGVYFRPIQLVISDGQYVEIPVKSRRGQPSRIFAHYYKNSLHFDHDRNCQIIQGSTRYSYDKRWDQGHNYTHINAGKDYDLNGLRLQIRNLPTDRRQVSQIVTNKVVNKQVVVREKDVKRSEKQSSNQLSLNSNNKKHEAVREQLHPVNSRAVKVSEYYAKNNQGRSSKVLITKNKSLLESNAETVKTTKRPTIVEKINSHEQTRRIAGEASQGGPVIKAVSVDRPPQKQEKSVMNTSKQSTEKNAREYRSTHKSVGRDVATQKASIKISLAGGTVAVNGKQTSFGKKSLTIKEGESRNVSLVARGGANINVPISYRNGILIVASSKQFKNDVSWTKGKTFNVNTQGSSRLDNVQVTIVSL